MFIVLRFYYYFLLSNDCCGLNSNLNYYYSSLECGKMGRNFISVVVAATAAVFVVVG